MIPASIANIPAAGAALTATTMCTRREQEQQRLRQMEHHHPQHHQKHGHGDGARQERNKWRRAGVRFDHHERVRSTTPLHEYTEAERGACWHTGEELDAIKLKAREDALRALLSKQGLKIAEASAAAAAESAPHHRPRPTAAEATSSSDSAVVDLRGLEHMADASMLVKREKRRQRTAAAVLEIQNRGRTAAGGGGVEFDAEAAARASRKITSKARREAERLGAEDARAAKAAADGVLHKRGGGKQKREDVANVGGSLLLSSSALRGKRREDVANGGGGIGIDRSTRRGRERSRSNRSTSTSTSKSTSELLDRVRTIAVRDLPGVAPVSSKRRTKERMSIAEAKTDDAPPPDRRRSPPPAPSMQPASRVESY